MISRGILAPHVFSLRPLLFSLCFLFLLGGIGPFQPCGWAAEETPSLAVLPIWVEKGGDPDKSATCPICRGIHRRGERVTSLPQTLTQGLYGKVEKLGIFRVIPWEQVEGTISGAGKQALESHSVPSAILLGKELIADFVMITMVFRFDERRGSSIGVESPASVAFDLHLFRVKDGKRVWDGRFDETQRPLSENLLQVGSFFRRKAKWLTAEELAEVGMEEQLQKMPGVRELLEKP